MIDPIYILQSIILVVVGWSLKQIYRLKADMEVIKARFNNHVSVKK